VTATRPYNGPTGYVNADGTPLTSDDWGWGTYPQNLQGIVADVIPLIDPLIDFSQYDNDNDGFVDSVIFTHAGPGAEITGSANDIWSSAWNLSVGQGPGPLLTQDGVSVDNFTFDPEYMVAPGDQTIGVYAHELGHTLFGLPDLYDPDNTSYGVGNWSLMGTGGWNGPLMWVPWIGWIPNGASPAWPDAWSRTVMGFEPTIMTDSDLPGWILPPVDTGPGLVVRLQSPQLGPKEYFLLENRQQIGFDSWLPGTGLLIWHVDEDKWNRWEHNTYECTQTLKCNCPVYHPLVSLEQADGALHLENKNNDGDGGDPFPGTSSNTAFGFGTTPESGSYYASSCPTNSCISVTNIVTSSPPLIQADLQVVCKSAGACANILPTGQVGWGQAGSTVTHTASVQNCSTTTDTFDLTTTGLWPSAVYTRSGQTAMTQTRSLAPGAVEYVNITVTVPSSASPGASDIITLSAASNNSPTVSANGLLMTRAPERVLLVDDDRGSPNVEGAYTMALSSNYIAYDYWNVNLGGSPSASTLAAHEAVVWFTGIPWPDTLSARDELALASYLDGGGQLFLSSQEYLYDAARSAFSRDYLHVGKYLDNTGTGLVIGQPGDPIGGRAGTYNLLPYATLSDQVTPCRSATTAFVDAGGISNAISHDSGTWKLLFLAWPFENLIPPHASGVMGTVMEWFGISYRIYLPLVLRNS
jgi:M6 family metalloprotease-like protein